MSTSFISTWIIFLAIQRIHQWMIFLAIQRIHQWMIFLAIQRIIELDNDHDKYKEV